MVVTALRVAGLCKVLVSALADTPEALLAATVYDTTTPASSRRCRRATVFTVRSVTVLPTGSTAYSALVKSAWNWGESVTPEMVCVALTTTEAVVDTGVGGAVAATGATVPVGDGDGAAFVGAGVGGMLVGAAVVGWGIGCGGCTVGS